MTKFTKFSALTLAATIALSSGVYATPSINSFERIAGEDRIETSLRIGEKTKEDTETVILAGYNGQADALTGTLLAQKENAPILLTNRDKVSPVLRDRLAKAKKVYLLGGTAVIDQSVEDALVALDLTVIRLAGSNRIDTAIAIVDEVFDTERSGKAFVVGYDALADALAVGSVSGSEGIPIYITNSNTLSPSVKASLVDNRTKDITIIGGKSVVSDDIITELDALTGNSAVRVAGDNRVKTSLAIFDAYYTTTKPEAVILANGYGTMADALVGGHLAADLNAPILLTQQNKIDERVLNIATDPELAETIDGVERYILGGEVSMSVELEELIATEFADRLVVHEINVRIKDLLTSDRTILEDILLFDEVGEMLADYDGDITGRITNIKEWMDYSAEVLQVIEVEEIHTLIDGLSSIAEITDEDRETIVLIDSKLSGLAEIGRAHLNIDKIEAYKALKEDVLFKDQNDEARNINALVRGITQNAIIDAEHSLKVITARDAYLTASEEVQLLVQESALIKLNKELVRIGQEELIAPIVPEIDAEG